MIDFHLNIPNQKSSIQKIFVLSLIHGTLGTFFWGEAHHEWCHLVFK